MKIANEKKLKKRMLIALIVALCLVPILFGLSLLVDHLLNKSVTNEDKPIDFDWFEADYDENIFEDEDYLKLIEYGFISYTDGSLTLGIERENAKNYGEEVEFMVEYLYSIIEGDADRYNSFFSNVYYKNHSRKDVFTMQKIYDVSLTKEPAIVSDDDTAEAEKYTFVLSYRIFENNGTFRKDIGDGYKRQYITVTNREGKLLIDSIATEKVVVRS